MLAAAAGVDPAKVREALLGGFAGSKVLEVHGQRMLDGAFEPGFRAALMAKDGRIVLDGGRTSRRAGPGLPRGRRTARGDAPGRPWRARLRRARHAARGRGRPDRALRAVRRELPDGYELDDDPARVDLDAVWAFLSTEAYWGRERTREVVERQVAEAVAGDRAVRRRPAGRLRPDLERRAEWRTWPTCTSCASTAAAGLGVELVRAAVDEGPHRDLRWMLHTRDAHGLYEKFGFGPPSDRLLERPPARERS